MAVITSLSAHDDTSEVSDLRARIEQQLIAAAKSGEEEFPLENCSNTMAKRFSASSIG